MRARYPDDEGYVERDGVRVFWELYGDGEPTLLFLPTWSVVHSRVWRGQLAYFARHYRVLTFDPRGNGRSDRPRDPAAYADVEFAHDALDVMDATGTERALLVGWSRGGPRGVLLAANHPERVIGAVLMAPSMRAPPRIVEAMAKGPLERCDGFDKFNPHYWRIDFEDFARWFHAVCHPEPHATRQIELGVEQTLATDADTLTATVRGPRLGEDALAELAARVRCPMLVVHGDRDAIVPVGIGVEFAQSTGADLVVLEGAGHGWPDRHPVSFNLILRDFVERLRPRRDQTVHRPNGRRRALFVSSPIGLGHAGRDVAIARELRALVPELEIDWLAQDPVTRVLEGAGERIHPASVELASECAHLEGQAGEHELHVFHAFRRMDEILLANFMLFHDVVAAEDYDLWIADEGWEIDHYLHENPDLKRAPYAWLTDVVGHLPMEDADERERFLTADYSAEMVEHVRDQPLVRDRAFFIGDPDDLVDMRLGPQLPTVREWTEQHYEFAGYVPSFDQHRLDDREALRAELGFSDGEPVCVVTVGGSGVGLELLRKVIAALPAARRLVPGLRMIAVAGPRIDPAALPRADGLEGHAYVHDLYRQLAACDLAVVQGGLTTTMELTAARRPFLYFPLRCHYEQQYLVDHRLRRHRAGRRMEYAQSTPETIAAAIAHEIDREVDYLPVETGGARRAAERIAELL